MFLFSLGFSLSAFVCVSLCVVSLCAFVGKGEFYQIEAVRSVTFI